MSTMPSLKSENLDLWPFLEISFEAYCIKVVAESEAGDSIAEFETVGDSDG
jgi:hypothetical protein